MTVRELIKELEKQPLDWEVIFQEPIMGRDCDITTVDKEEGFERLDESIINAVILL